MNAKPSDLIARRARAFRRALTEPEVMLWSRLKGRGRDRPIFRRQVPFGSIILDFYCPAARLAVEVDGLTHWSDEKRAKDGARDAWLASQGIDVLRPEAGRVYRDLTGAADAVILRAEERIRTRTLRPSLSTARSAADGPPLPLRGKGRHMS
jgi:very-short-patch-repair endonuclease